VREGVVDELGQIDPDDTNRQNPETGCGDRERRSPASPRPQRRLDRSNRRQAEIEPPGVSGLDDAGAQPLPDRLGFDRHPSQRIPLLFGYQPISIRCSPGKFR
jgi:hypothetical protein